MASSLVKEAQGNKVFEITADFRAHLVNFYWSKGYLQLYIDDVYRQIRLFPKKRAESFAETSNNVFSENADNRDLAR